MSKNPTKKAIHTFDLPKDIVDTFLDRCRLTGINPDNRLTRLMRKDIQWNIDNIAGDILSWAASGKDEKWSRISEILKKDQSWLDEYHEVDFPLSQVASNYEINIKNIDTKQKLGLRINKLFFSLEEKKVMKELWNMTKSIMKSLKDEDSLKELIKEDKTKNEI